MAYRSPSTINATKGLQEFIVYASEITNYWFGNMIIISVFLISLTYYLHTYGTRDFWSGVAIAGYFAFVVSIFLWLMNAVTTTAMTLVLGAVTAATFALWLNNKEQ